MFMSKLNINRLLNNKSDSYDLITFDQPTIFINSHGCGGFGKGNFKSLFESVEKMQKDRNICY